MLLNFIKKRTIKPENILIIFIGESNSGGIGQNVSATNSELYNIKTKIFDITDNQFRLIRFVNPGSNNLLGHHGLESSIGVGHGWEMPINNRNISLSFKKNNVFICKCGQGGTTVANWVDHTAYDGIYAYDEFISKKDSAIAKIRQINNNSIKIVVFFSLGINDAIVHTSKLTFKTKLQTLLANILSELAADSKNNLVEIYGTEIMLTDSYYTDINAALTESASELDYFYTIQTSDASQIDANHWDYAGVNLIGNRMIDLFLSNYY